MPIKSRILALALVLLCSAAQAQTHVDLQRIVGESGVSGVVYVRTSGGAEYVSDQQRVDTGFLPASTFKILHALIALETGVVPDENAVIPWDGKDRGYAPWNEDQTLRSSIRNSTVWAFQRIATEIGRERMQHWVERVGYGNRDISGNMDSFWLDGGLRITPRQQAAFVERLYRGALPFSERNMEIVKSCLLLEKGENWSMFAKTGWAQRVTPQIGWLVGWVLNGGDAFFFATSVTIQDKDDAKARFTLSKAALEAIGAFE